jgi:choline kinase
MRVIVLAAGMGRRLRPHTTELPKCLLRVGGKTIVERLLGQLRAAGVAEVVLVVGYRAELVERGVRVLADRPPVRFVRNLDYERTNSIVSLLATVPFWDEDFVVVDSDLLVSPRLLERLLAVPGNAMVVDAGRAPEEVDMAVELRAGMVWDLGKDLPAERSSGESVPLSRFSVAGGARLGRILRRMVDEGATDVWYQYAIRVLAKETRIAALPARSDEWIEVDRPDDLAAAAAAFGPAA